MAAAEARAGWRQTANRCLFQEGSRSAPKLFHCPQSSSKLESDSGPGDAENGLDHIIPGPAGRMPFNHSSSKPDLLADTEWLLHLQNSCMEQKILSHEQVDSLETDVEILNAGPSNQTVKVIEESQLIEEYCIQTYAQTNAGVCLDQPWKFFPTCMEYDLDIKMQDLEVVINDNLQKTATNTNMRNCRCHDDHLDLDPSISVVSEQPMKLCSDTEFHWIGVEKAEPWWRMADKDELASLVSHKSVEHIENCDLPQPQIKHLKGQQSACPQCSDQVKNFVFSDQMVKEVSNVADAMQRVPTLVSIDTAQSTLGAAGCSPHGSDRSFGKDGFSSIKRVEAETHHGPNSELSKAQLLEALCHSQTRAREAEKVAHQAYNEKEHIIKLFFRQASHLFAYRQWLQMLHLETPRPQLRNKNLPISTHFTPFLPWALYRGRKLRKAHHKAARWKQGSSRCKMSKCAVAFGLGLSLAGAGLLGWTMGWLFPAL